MEKLDINQNYKSYQVRRTLSAFEWGVKALSYKGKAILALTAFCFLALSLSAKTSTDCANNTHIAQYEGFVLLNGLNFNGDIQDTNFEVETDANENDNDNAATIRSITIDFGAGPVIYYKIAIPTFYQLTRLGAGRVNSAHTQNHLRENGSSQSFDLKARNTSCGRANFQESELAYDFTNRNI